MGAVAISMGAVRSEANVRTTTNRRKRWTLKRWRGGMPIAGVMRNGNLNWRMEYDLPRPNSQNPSHPKTNRIKSKRNGRTIAHDQTAVHTNGTTSYYLVSSEADGDSKNFGDNDNIEMTP